jgi:hypothetical protein
MTIYAPIMRYSLPTTSITDKHFWTIQKPVVKSVLSRLGFNLNMPRAVIHSSTLYGGVGLIDLYNEQGCAQIPTVLSHLRFQQYLYKSIITLIKSYMILTGTITSPFIDTAPIYYVKSPWIQSLQTSLHQTNSQIIIPTLSTIQLLRK